MEEMEEDFLPMSHQLGRVARVAPFQLQGMKTSILYDDEEYVQSPRTALKSKQLLSNKSIFNSTYSEPKQQSIPFQKLDISTKGANVSATAALGVQNSLNTSLFQPAVVSSEGPIERTAKLAKKSHLFKTGLFQQNTSTLGMQTYNFIYKSQQYNSACT